MEKCNFSLTHFGGMDIAEKKGKQCYGSGPGGLGGIMGRMAVAGVRGL